MKRTKRTKRTQRQQQLLAHFRRPQMRKMPLAKYPAASIETGAVFNGLRRA